MDKSVDNFKTRALKQAGFIIHYFESASIEIVRPFFARIFSGRKALVIIGVLFLDRRASTKY